MAVFVLADTHLSTVTEKPMDIFGKQWIDWDKKLIYNWIDTVCEDDTVIIPGDISWGISLSDAKEDLCLINALPGKKIISRGNHDYWWSTVSKMNIFFEENGINSISFLYNNAYKAENTVICGTRGWFTDEKTANAAKLKTDYAKLVNREAGRLELSLNAAEEICRKATENENPEKVAFFHFPPVFGQYVCRPLVDLLHAHGIKRAYYGHIHGQYDIPSETDFEGISFSLISADYLSFRPKRVN